jgi:hypothetical protein
MSSGFGGIRWFSVFIAHVFTRHRMMQVIALAHYDERFIFIWQAHEIYRCFTRIGDPPRRPKPRRSGSLKARSIA